MSGLLQQRMEQVGKRSLFATEPRGIHRLRLQIKKLRYTADVFAPLFDRADVVPFVARLKELQHELGAAHDAAVEQVQVSDLSRTFDGSELPVLTWMKEAAAKTEASYTWFGKTS